MKISLPLLLLTISVALAEVPTGCVTILSTYSNAYLQAANWYDKNHRHVKHAAGPEHWEIKKSGSNYRIMHVKHQEYLFASYWTVTGGSHYVYLWIPRTDEETDKWEIGTKPGTSYYYIRNVKRGACLYPSSREWIYAKPEKICNVDSMEWKIEKC